MATPIDNKALLHEFLEGSTTEKEKQHSTTEEFPKVENIQAASTGEEKQHKNLRFSITMPAPLALSVREYVAQATIQHLMKGDSYNLSRFFSEAAIHYMQEKQQAS